jgi:phytanoyl-CoA hydroxylase
MERAMAVPNQSCLAQYKSDGFLVVENLVSATELTLLRDRMSGIAAGEFPSFPAHDIEFEPNADGVDTTSTRESHRVRKINRCAENDDVFMAHAANLAILDVVSSLIGPDIKLFGSQCFMKPPGGIEKPYHQDSAYFHIEPKELVTCWTALDDATLENGCLCVIPGSHKGQILNHDQPWQVGDRVDMQVREKQIDRSREIQIELASGSCSFHHSKLLHSSGANHTDQSRRGLAVHYMSARSRWVHPTDAKPDYMLLRGQEYEGCV